MLLPFLAFLAIPACVFAAQEATYQNFVRLAAENQGVIPLNSDTFAQLTAPKRDWSATVLFTALDKKRRCSPCK